MRYNAGAAVMLAAKAARDKATALALNGRGAPIAGTPAERACAGPFGRIGSAPNASYGRATSWRCAPRGQGS
jgi:hypothetical protein